MVEVAVVVAAGPAAHPGAAAGITTGATTEETEGTGATTVATIVMTTESTTDPTGEPRTPEMVKVDFCHVVERDSANRVRPDNLCVCFLSGAGLRPRITAEVAVEEEEGPTGHVHGHDPTLHVSKRKLILTCIRAVSGTQ